LIQSTCSNLANQLFVADPTATNHYRISATHSNKVLSVDADGNTLGAIIQQWIDNKLAKQRWLFSNSTLSIVSSVDKVGRWGTLIAWPHIAMTAANMPDARVLNTRLVHWLSQLAIAAGAALVWTLSTVTVSNLRTWYRRFHLVISMKP
ncbi:MAG: RICIN domain-containing protein, partial [Burkholderiaceae bacterium]